MNKNIFILIISLACIGVVQLGLLLHEGIHFLQADNPDSICYDFGKSSIAHVTAKNFVANTEWYAYGFESLFILTCCSCLVYLANKELNNK